MPEILCRYRVHGRSRTATEAYIAHEQLKLIMAFRHPPAESPPPPVAAAAAGKPASAAAGKPRKPGPAKRPNR